MASILPPGDYEIRAEERTPVTADRGMTVAEAGRRGGEAVKHKYGREYYSEIGKKGGDSIKSTRGPGYYSEIGKKGGATHTREQLSEWGRKGGLATKAKAEASGDPTYYYSKIGRKGAYKGEIPLDKKLTPDE